MQKNNARLCSVLALLSVIAAIGVRIYSLLNGRGGAADYVFYGISVFGLSMIAYDCFKRKKYAMAFGHENSFHLSAFSFLASLGFFIDFVLHCVRIYYSVEDGSAHLLLYFIPQCFICLFSLASSFYFCTVAMSFKSSRYDFRALKFIHLVPVVWAGARIIALIEQADILKGNPDAVLKYAVLAFSLCFFYMFAYEVEREDSAKSATVFFSRGLAYFSELYFLDRLMLVLAGQASVYEADSVFAVTAILLCGFSFFFEKNIISKTTDTEIL